MPYFRNINTLYIHVPKTGGMSIEEYFYSKTCLDKNEKSIYGGILTNRIEFVFPKNVLYNILPIKKY